jgi:hypothetical protein
VDPGPNAETTFVGGVDFLATVDVEREVLDPDVVVLVLTTVCGTEPEVLVAVAEVDDFLAFVG